MRMLRSRIADAAALEDVIQIVRRAVKERDFFLSVATLEGRLDADAAGRQRTALAEAAFIGSGAAGAGGFRTRFGRVAGGALAVVAMGKAGGREMMAGSDLDLMFIYDHPPEVAESRGARSLPVSQWFVRAVQACIAALTAPGPEGQMYALDMRLRPSGNKGPIAVSLARLQALSRMGCVDLGAHGVDRARVGGGAGRDAPPGDEAIEMAIRRQQEPARNRGNATSMRGRMARELRPHGPWDVKLRAGGLIDIEFIAQGLQLVHVARSRTSAAARRRTWRCAGWRDAGADRTGGCPAADRRRNGCGARSRACYE